MGCNKVERRIMKISTVNGATPTAAPSNDHTDGSWDELDIYIGEWFFNQTDGRLFTRDVNGIKEVSLEQAGVKMYRAVLSQTGSAPGDPTPGFEDNRLGDTVTYEYANTGEYDLVCVGMFAVPTNVFILIGSGRSLSHQIIAYVDDDDTIKIKTGSPASANDILNNTAIYILIFP